jgi:hypothetical protein
MLQLQISNDTIENVNRVGIGFLMESPFVLGHLAVENIRSYLGDTALAPNFICFATSFIATKKRCALLGNSRVYLVDAILPICVLTELG